MDPPTSTLAPPTVLHPLAHVPCRVVFRRATATDYDTCFRFEKCYMENVEPANLKKWEEGNCYRRQYDGDMMRGNRTFVLELVTKGGGEGGEEVKREAVGYYWWVPEEGVALLCSIVVDPRMRNLGLGRAIISHFESQARLEGITTATFGCQQEDVAAATLYKRCGYVQCGLFPTYGIVYRNFTKAL